MIWHSAIVVLMTVFMANAETASSKYKQLSEETAERAISQFSNAGWEENFNYFPKVRSKTYQERQYWLSRNEGVRKNLESFFREQPHTIQNSGGRARNIALLGRLRAEWSVRLLFEEVMKDRAGQELNGLEELMKTNKIDEKHRQFVIELLIHNGPKIVRSDEKSAVSLGKLGLKEEVITFDQTRPMKPYLEDLRSWYSANKDRLDEVVLATWPDALVDEKVEVEEEGAVSGGSGVVDRSGESVERDREVDNGDDGVLRGDVIEETRAWGWYVGALVFLVMLGGWFFVGRRG